MNVSDKIIEEINNIATQVEKINVDFEKYLYDTDVIQGYSLEENKNKAISDLINIKNAIKERSVKILGYKVLWCRNKI